MTVRFVRNNQNGEKSSTDATGIRNAILPPGTSRSLSHVLNAVRLLCWKKQRKNPEHFSLAGSKDAGIGLKANDPKMLQSQRKHSVIKVSLSGMIGSGSVNGPVHSGWVGGHPTPFVSPAGSPVRL